MPCSAFNELRYKLILPTNKRTFNALRSSAPLFSHLLLSPLVWWTCGKCEKPHRHKNKSYNTTHDISPHIRIVRPFDLQCFLLSIDQKPGRNGSLLCFSTCASDFISGVWPSFCNGRREALNVPFAFLKVRRCAESRTLLSHLRRLRRKCHPDVSSSGAIQADRR